MQPQECTEKQNDSKCTKKRTYEKPTLSSEPLFESVAGGQTKADPFDLGSGCDVASAS